MRIFNKGFISKSLAVSFVLFCSPLFAEQNMPEFSLTHFSNGQNLTHEQLKGKVLYIDFWASWCVPCRKTFPFMNELTSTYEGKDFKVIAINMDENSDDAKGFLAKFPANFDVYVDAGNHLAEKLNLPGIPTAYIVDKQGLIRATHMGFRKSTKTKTLSQIRYLVEQE